LRQVGASQLAGVADSRRVAGDDRFGDVEQGDQARLRRFQVVSRRRQPVPTTERAYAAKAAAKS
jgi:hypothetical protein